MRFANRSVGEAKPTEAEKQEARHLYLSLTLNLAQANLRWAVQPPPPGGQPQGAPQGRLCDGMGRCSAKPWILLRLPLAVELA